MAIQDQFGGVNCRKLTGRRIRDKLLETHELPAELQKEILDQFITDWMEEGDQSQLGDILVIGVQLDCSKEK